MKNKRNIPKNDKRKSKDPVVTSCQISDAGVLSFKKIGIIDHLRFDDGKDEPVTKQLKLLLFNRSQNQMFSSLQTCETPRTKFETDVKRC